MVEQQDTLIVTPTLGIRDSIRRTVESVLEFGAGRVKHALVCPEASRVALAERFPHCEILVEQKNLGVFGGVNFGLEWAQGKYRYLGYLNDDDRWLPDFRRLFACLDEKPKVDIAYGRVLFVDSHDKPIFESTSSANFQSFRPLLVRGAVIIAQQAALMRSQVFEKLKCFDTSYRLIADSDFWLRGMEHGFHFEYVNQTCATFMLQPGQLSSDRNLLNEELERLLTGHGIHRDWSAFWSFVRFRLENIPAYLRRWRQRKLNRVESIIRGKV